jgi:hypothetical protein
MERAGRFDRAADDSKQAVRPTPAENRRHDVGIVPAMARRAVAWAGVEKKTAPESSPAPRMDPDRRIRR